MERAEMLTRFAAAKQFASDLEAVRQGAFALGRPWTEKQQAELDEAKRERGLLARELTQQSIADRGTPEGDARREPTGEDYGA